MINLFSKWIPFVFYQIRRCKTFLIKLYPKATDLEIDYNYLKLQVIERLIKLNRKTVNKKIIINNRNPNLKLLVLFDKTRNNNEYVYESLEKGRFIRDPLKEFDWK